jgi:serine/threonine-protein kinase
MSLEPKQRLLDRYEIRSRLGKGGMGEVYLAWDLKLQRQIVIKVLLGDIPSELMRLRFIQEARMVASLNHPNIVPSMILNKKGRSDFSPWNTLKV